MSEIHRKIRAIGIVGMLDVDINVSYMVDSVVTGTVFVKLSHPAK